MWGIFVSLQENARNSGRCVCGWIPSTDARSSAPRSGTDRQTSGTTAPKSKHKNTVNPRITEPVYNGNLT